MNSFALIKENLIFSLNSTVPIFLLIILGWFLMQIKLFNKDFTAACWYGTPPYAILWVEVRSA